MPDVCYRNINPLKDENNSILGCGYLDKKIGGTGDFIGTLGYFSVVWVLSGRGVYIDKEGNTFPLQRGSVFYRMPDRYHKTLTKSDNWREFFIGIGRNISESLFDADILNGRKCVFECEITPQMTAVFDSLLENMKTACNSILPGVLLQCVNIAYNYSGFNFEVKKDPLKEKLDIACDMLSRDLKGSAGIKDIAQSAGVSYSYFRKLFKNRYGINPQEYRMRSRITMAKHLLKGNILTVPEISDYLGFCDEFAFSKQFKKKTGFSPVQYRKF